MKPTELLMQEHRVIEQVLDCLEIMAQRANAGDKLDVESAKQAIDFFGNFADKCHHGKEEDCLFPLLEEKGFSREQGPTGVMLHEHEEGRRHVRGMAEATSAWQMEILWPWPILCPMPRHLSNFSESISLKRTIACSK